MGEWQPHRTNLLPPRRQTVEDAPRDDEVRTRIVVRERETELEVVDGCDRARERGRSRNQDGDSTMSLQGVPSLHSAECVVSSTG